jgi:hypothetical protein
MEQTTARLRKTFHYPTDNDSENYLPEDLDEEGILFTFPFQQVISLSPPTRLFTDSS